MPSGTHAMSTYRMNCGEASEKLPLYVGGDLDPEVLAAVRQHLETCPECVTRATAGERARGELKRALQSAEAGSTTPGLWPGIRSTLRSEGLIHEAGEPVQVAATRSARRARSAAWFAPLAAAAAVIAVLQLSGLFGTERKGTPLQLPKAPPTEVAMPVREVIAPTLQRIGPGEVQPLIPFAGQRQTLRGEAPASGQVSVAGYGPVR